MIKIPNYTITEKLYETARTTIYRGEFTPKILNNTHYQLSVGTSVIIKHHNENYPTPESLAKLKREYEIARTIQEKYAVKSVDLEQIGNSLAIIFEDTDSISLSSYLEKNRIPIDEFLSIAIKITDALDSIHSLQIIHKDINPSNIVINPQTGEIKLIDFGISTVLTRENPTVSNFNKLEGTLAYISPEQTGRMNRIIDYRSDFYSLGATFYYMLTGRTPFLSDDPMEMVHSHIAKIPTLPSEFNRDIPPPINKIILKLLEKGAENRYQSLYGLKKDLERSLEEYSTSNDITHFDIGEYDYSSKFVIPYKLYGRENELADLSLTLDKISSNSIELLLIKGEAGIGKSMLVSEIHKLISGKNGYFISGGFDQFKQNEPYSAFVSAFRSIISQILTENESSISDWKERFINNIGKNGKIITEIISDFELIIGEQPELAELPAGQAEKRFYFVFKNFIKTFTEVSTIVLFLDNLQWIDNASCRLLEEVFADSDIRNMMIIGAYREEEVDNTHQLSITLNEIGKILDNINTITLHPLDFHAINNIVADTLKCNNEKSSELSNLILEKTNGNPFFVRQFLQTLYDDNLIYLSDSKSWEWNQDGITKKKSTENVVEMMIDKICRLDDKVQLVLQIASCVGNPFKLSMISMIIDKPIKETYTILKNAIQSGLIIPADENYKFIEHSDNDIDAEFLFIHDRIQQAAYSLINNENISNIQFKIARLMLQLYNQTEVEQNIFSIVNNLNDGKTHISNPQDLQQLFDLNYLAAKKGKLGFAYDQSYKYFTICEEVIENLHSENAWIRDNKSTTEFYLQYAETTYLNGNLSEMDRICDLILEKSDYPLDKIKVYNLRIQSETSSGKLKESVSTGLKALKLLGIKFPKNPGIPSVIIHFIKTVISMAGKNTDDILNLKKMTDKNVIETMNILSSVSTAAYYTNRNLMMLIVLKMVRLSMKHGNGYSSSYAYSTYGLLLSGIGFTNSGYDFGQLALEMISKNKVNEFTARTLTIINTFTLHYKVAVKKFLPNYFEIYKIAMETGDLDYFSNTAVLHSNYAFFSGEMLDKLSKLLSDFYEKLLKINQITYANMLGIYLQTINNMTTLVDNTTSLNGEYFNEDIMIDRLKESNDNTSLFLVYQNKVILSYIFEDYQQALFYCKNGEKLLQTMIGTMHSVVFIFFQSLTLLAIFKYSSPRKKLMILIKVSIYLALLKKWAGTGKENYLHKWFLVKAELARVQDKDLNAIKYYNQAISLAKSNKYINDEAIANELAYKFYNEKIDPNLAIHFLKESYYCYQNWGVTAKIDSLKQKYPDLLNKMSDNRQKGVNSSISSSSSSVTGSHVLDITSVIKASGSISGEINLSELLKKLMSYVAENAGAQSGCLILEKNNNWFIEAQVFDSGKNIEVLNSIPINHKIEDHPILPLRIINFVLRSKKPLVLNDAAYDEKFMKDPYINAKNPKSILCMPLLNKGELKGILYLENNLFTNVFSDENLNILSLLSSQMAISIENAGLYTHLNDLNKAFVKFVPNEFIHYLNKKGILEVKLGDNVQKKMTILFSDIRSFTTLSEQMTPEETFRFINSYLKEMGPIVRENNGFIDKYIGDAIMALFPKNADDAVQASILMLHKLALYNLNRIKAGYKTIKIGIGINTGKMMLGTIGESDRMESTVISDSVNLASRIESLTKQYHVPLIISYDTYADLKNLDYYQVRYIDSVKVKGKELPTKIFEVFNSDSDDVIKIKLDTRHTFEDGVNLYNSRDYKEALKHFQDVHNFNKSDPVAELYIKRCNNSINETIDD